VGHIDDSQSGRPDVMPPGLAPGACEAFRDPYLNSAWQIALLLLFVLVGLVGVGLMVRDGHPVDPSGDPSS
jgi:hypothetical protein